GSDGVRLMTVHKAKGLEFPVVILADITARMARSPSGRYIDPVRGLCAVRIGGWSPVGLIGQEGRELERDLAEGVRVAYVAATRARDLLVIPAIGDGAWGAGDTAGNGGRRQVPRWIAPLNDAIYPEPGRERDATPAPGCPEFGEDCTTSRPG